LSHLGWAPSPVATGVTPVPLGEGWSEALNHIGFRAMALNLAWFRGRSTIVFSNLGT